MDLKKCWGVENVWGYANKFCVWIKKKIGGGVVMPKYFIDLKKCWGVCGRMPKHFRDLEKMLGGGVMPKYFTDLKNFWGGGMPTNLWT